MQRRILHICLENLQFAALLLVLTLRKAKMHCEDIMNVRELAL